ncbi:MAG: Beta-phosphoglucomutase [Phycisphaerae bacterium]|nr:Beta-phosphoglucomutase [Phycisphaerae bacterium]
MKQACGVIFDLDGVLTDTAELHYQSWLRLAEELGISFDRQRNEALRGISRGESLKIVLGERAVKYGADEQAAMAEKKNRHYQELVDRMTQADMLPGALDLLRGLRTAGVRVAVASSSRNAKRVVDHLNIRDLLDAVIDGTDTERSKPDPTLFLMAAAAIDVPPRRCIVVEDAESGVDAGLAAGMTVVGLGPRSRVGRAHRVCESLTELTAARLVQMIDRGRTPP